MTDSAARCLYCERGSDSVPLLSLEYRGKNLSICPEHLPILIHNPAQLIGRLEGADNLSPADHQD